jgi:hypothetical protein
VYAPKGSKSINTILLSCIILFLFLLIFLVVLVVFIALSRKALGLTLRDKVHNFARTPALVQAAGRSTTALVHLRAKSQQQEHSTITPHSALTFCPPHVTGGHRCSLENGRRHHRSPPLWCAHSVCCSPSNRLAPHPPTLPPCCRGRHRTSATASRVASPMSASIPTASLPLASTRQSG